MCRFCDFFVSCFQGLGEDFETHDNSRQQSKAQEKVDLVLTKRLTEKNDQDG
jgi:hypothetical protein